MAGGCQGKVVVVVVVVVVVGVGVGVVVVVAASGSATCDLYSYYDFYYILQTTFSVVVVVVAVVVAAAVAVVVVVVVVVTVELVGVAVAVVLVVARVVVVVVVVVLVVAVALSRQKETSCRTLLARERRELLTISCSSSEDGIELTLKKKGWSSPDLQKQKSGPPPLPSLQNREDEYSTSCSYCSGLERLSALFHRRRSFPATMLLKTINREECPHHPFKALML